MLVTTGTLLPLNPLPLLPPGMAAVLCSPAELLLVEGCSLLLLVLLVPCEPLSTLDGEPSEPFEVLFMPCEVVPVPDGVLCEVLARPCEGPSTPPDELSRP